MSYQKMAKYDFTRQLILEPCEPKLQLDVLHPYIKTTKL